MEIKIIPKYTQKKSIRTLLLRIRFIKTCKLTAGVNRYPFSAAYLQ